MIIVLSRYQNYIDAIFSIMVVSMVGEGLEPHTIQTWVGTGSLV